MAEEVAVSLGGRGGEARVRGRWSGDGGVVVGHRGVWGVFEGWAVGDAAVFAKPEVFDVEREAGAWGGTADLAEVCVGVGCLREARVFGWWRGSGVLELFGSDHEVAHLRDAALHPVGLRIGGEAVAACA